MASQRTWMQTIQAKRLRQHLKSFAFLLLALIIWWVLVALFVWAWQDVFHQLPPGDVFVWALGGLGSAIIIPFAATRPLPPMEGPDPEQIAADEFFNRDSE